MKKITQEFLLAAQTRREVEDALRKEGIVGPAVEALCALGASERHQRRISAAREAALEAASQDKILAVAILEADLYGIGGNSLWPNGAGTSRVPALRELGSGRKHARDGSAWEAALEAAKSSLLAELGQTPAPPYEPEKLFVDSGWQPESLPAWRGINFVPLPEGNLGVRLIAAAPLYDGGAWEDLLGAVVSVPEGLVPPEWRHSIAAAELQHALENDGDVGGWAAVYNAAALPPPPPWEEELDG